MSVNKTKNLFLYSLNFKADYDAGSKFVLAQEYFDKNNDGYNDSDGKKLTEEQEKVASGKANPTLDYSKNKQGITHSYNQANYIQVDAPQYRSNEIFEHGNGDAQALAKVYKEYAKDGVLTKKETETLKELDKVLTGAELVYGFNEKVALVVEQDKQYKQGDETTFVLFADEMNKKDSGKKPAR